MIRKDHKVTDSEKAFAKDLAGTLNGGDRSKLKILRSSGFERTPEDPDVCIDTLQCLDCPSEGISTYATLNASLDEEPGEPDPNHRMELIGAAQTAFDDFPNVFPGIAQLAWLNRWTLKEGVIIRNVFSGLKSTTLSHALVSRPVRWPRLMKGFVVDGRALEFWWVIPIYEPERLLAGRVGKEKLLTIILEKEDEVFNLIRESAKDR
jgi:hypothetical protein